jgi:hypothetical protein
MNKEQQELLDEANNNYLNKCLDKKWMKENVFFDGSSNHHLYLKEEFINKCKTDTEFSENWGLKIEERELTWDESNEYYNNHQSLKVPYLGLKVPTKLITITYNDTKLESYE